MFGQSETAGQVTWEGEIVRNELLSRSPLSSPSEDVTVAHWKNETALVADIVKQIKKEYPAAFVFKAHGGPMQEPGIPDLLLCIMGHFFGLEVKHQKPKESEEHARERATPLQRIQIQRINASGGTGRVVLTPEEALDVIKQALSE